MTSAGSSLEVRFPSALEVKGVYQPRRYLPLRSDLAVSHDLAGLLRLRPSRSLCGWHSWDSLAYQGNSRPPEQLPRCRDCCALMTLLERCPPSAGAKPLRRAAAPYLPAVSSGLHSVGRPLSLTSGFPFARTRPPHGVSCGTPGLVSDLTSASNPSKLVKDLAA
jgi:hypothetical protein